MNIKQLRDLADELFTKKFPLTSLHQEIADNFYPERADFTIRRSMGTDFAANLMSSYPIQCRRDLGNQFGTMLRPTAKPWFHAARRYTPKDLEDIEVRAFLEWFTETQRRAMYDPHALFTRATKEGDHDFAAFGQCAISVELNRDHDGLLYRCWHLRDMCWQENELGKIGFVARRWKPTAQTLKRTFRDRVHDSVTRMLEKQPFAEVDCLHLVVEADMYDDNARGRPRWSLWYDTQHDQLMDATPIWGKHYVIPRWQTVSGVQYSYSPATVAALPDARLLQAMTFTLLEAGEKATSPPMVAVQDVIRSDMALYAGGVTYVDAEYDERLGEALRPIAQDFRGFNFGLQMNQDTRAMLHSAFFLNALSLPERAPEMTAYEVGQRVQQYIRNALPIFEPMEDEYNAAICEETFELMWRNGGFGNPTSWPKKLQGAEIDFSFESPLHDAVEEMKGQKFQQAQTIIGEAVALDPSCALVPKAEIALRDALMGIGVPARWLFSEAQVQQRKKDQEAAQQKQATLANLEQASNVAKNIGQSGMAPAAVAAPAAA
ncbi:MAG TPA: portal protein [Burkholderiaceae bacterium]